MAHTYLLPPNYSESLPEVRPQLLSCSALMAYPAASARSTIWRWRFSTSTSGSALPHYAPILVDSGTPRIYLGPAAGLAGLKVSPAQQAAFSAADGAANAFQLLALTVVAATASNGCCIKCNPFTLELFPMHIGIESANE